MRIDKKTRPKVRESAIAFIPAEFNIKSVRMAETLLLNSALINSEWDIRSIDSNDFKIRLFEPTKATPADIVIPKLQVKIMCVSWNESVSQLAEKINIWSVRNTDKLLVILVMMPKAKTEAFAFISLQDNLYEHLDVQSRQSQVIQLLPVHSTLQVHSIISRIVTRCSLKSCQTAHTTLSSIASSFPALSLNCGVWASMLRKCTAESKCSIPFHDALVMQDGLGSFLNVMQASVSDMQACSLDEATATGIYTFFHPS